MTYPFYKKVTLISIAALAAMSAAPAVAVDEYNTSIGNTLAGEPLGLHGIDTVAFIQTGNRIEGSWKYKSVHDGVAYYFSSQQNLDAFTANPAQFLPQNGGFCTFGMSVGKKFNGDPRWADVRGGKLYVFLNGDIFNEYQKDPEGTIAKAAANWKKFRSVAVDEL